MENAQVLCRKCCDKQFCFMGQCPWSIGSSQPSTHPSGWHHWGQKRHRSPQDFPGCLVHIFPTVITSQLDPDEKGDGVCLLSHSQWVGSGLGSLGAECSQEHFPGRWELGLGSWEHLFFLKNKDDNSSSFHTHTIRPASLSPSVPDSSPNKA